MRGVLIRAVSRLRRLLLCVAMLGVVTIACAGSTGTDSTSGSVAGTDPVPPPTSASSSTSLVPAPTSTSSTIGVGVATHRFLIPAGPSGVTYLDGDPPSGPSSFAVLDDGSVVLADTMAVGLGAPRLLHYDRFGVEIALIDLVPAEVASIVDIATDGKELALLDVDVSTNRYRIVHVSQTGALGRVIDIPFGYWFSDGLSGLLWDDLGVLLEMEGGAWYVRVHGDNSVEAGVAPVFNGLTVAITPGASRSTEVTVGDARWTVTRQTDLGGVTLIGLDEDGSIVVSVDEVDTSGPAFKVRHRILRFDRSGILVTEGVVDPSAQYVEIMRPFELASDGIVLYLAAHVEGVEIVPETDGLLGPVAP